MSSLLNLLNTAQITGLTIYVRNGKVQVSIRSDDSDGWSVTQGSSISETLVQALENRHRMLKTEPEFSFFDPPPEPEMSFF